MKAVPAPTETHYYNYKFQFFAKMTTFNRQFACLLQLICVFVFLVECLGIVFFGALKLNVWDKYLQTLEEQVCAEKIRLKSDTSKLRR